MKNQYRMTSREKANKDIKMLEKASNLIAVLMIVLCITASITLHPLAFVVPALFSIIILSGIGEQIEELKKLR